MCFTAFLLISCHVISSLAGIESFSKLADSIFFAAHTSDGPELVISHFLPSEASWKAVGMTVRMDLVPPTAASPALRVSISIVEEEETRTEAEANKETQTKTGAETGRGGTEEEQASVDRGDQYLRNIASVAAEVADDDVPGEEAADVAASEWTDGYRGEELMSAVATLSARVPSWSLPPCEVELNGESIACPPPGKRVREGAERGEGQEEGGTRE